MSSGVNSSVPSTLYLKSDVEVIILASIIKMIFSLDCSHIYLVHTKHMLSISVTEMN